MAKSAKQCVRQIQASDPWVIQLAESATRDTNYISMIHHLENGIMAQDLPQDSELKQCEGILSDLSTMTLKQDKH